jgi:hypothetical protein
MMRLWTRLRKHLRHSALARWLSDQQDVVWGSIVEPTQSALSDGPPRLEEYKGLRALTELVAATGGKPQWQLVWSSEWAADRNEASFARRYGQAGAVRFAIRYVEVPKRKWWTKPVPVTLALALLGTIATAVSNIESLRNFATEVTHTPTLSLETTQLVRAASDVYDPREVDVRGDPYFRSRISGITMTIVPDPEFPGTEPLPNDHKTVLSGSIRALDVSEKVSLPIPLNKLPAGRYLIKLNGAVHTAGFQTGQFSPEDIKLEIRPPVRSVVRQLTPWPAEEATRSGRASEALVDLRFEFGRVSEATSSMRIVIPGKWTHWKHDPDTLPSGQSIERQSVNSEQRPNAVLFLLKDVPSPMFGSRSIRIHLYSQSPLTTEQWQNAIADQYADLLP